MRRTLKILGLIGMATAAGVAAAKRATPESSPADFDTIDAIPNVSHELRQALNRFEERFGT